MRKSRKLGKLNSVNNKMEDKENATVSTGIWNEGDSILENTFVSPKNLNTHVLKQIKTNCNSPNNTTVADAESAAVKSKVMSFTQTFLQKANIKKQIKAEVSNSVPCISDKRILGSYRGKIVSSKVNSFRKVPANEPSNSLPKSATTNNASIKDAKVTGNASVPKVLNSKSLQTSTVRVSVYHPKTILNHEKQSIGGGTENTEATQKNSFSNQKSLLKTVPINANHSVPRTKKLASSKTVSGSLKVPLSESHASESHATSKSIKKAPTSVDVRRLQLAEWQASKGIKKVHHTIPVNSQPKKTCQQTIKEPAESFWATIVEEDEQGLLSDKVSKTLAECVDLIEKGFVGERVYSILENLIVKVPEAKKFAKYWVCQMRLEQFRSTEKVITIYENAILAGAQFPQISNFALMNLILYDAFYLI
ncbi:Cytoskeleton-associated protein 2, partial [Ophiophagus hannah]